jgi:hypothetical protein
LFSHSSIKTGFNNKLIGNAKNKYFERMLSHCMHCNCIICKRGNKKLFSKKRQVKLIPGRHRTNNLKGWRFWGFICVILHVWWG